MKYERISLILGKVCFVLLVVAVIIFLVSTYTLVNTALATFGQSEGPIITEKTTDPSTGKPITLVRATVLSKGFISVTAGVKVKVYDPQQDSFLEYSNYKSIPPGSIGVPMAKVPEFPKGNPAYVTLSLRAIFNTTAIEFTLPMGGG